MPLGGYQNVRTTSMDKWEEWTFLSDDGHTYLVTTHTTFYPEIHVHDFEITSITDESGAEVDGDDPVREEIEDSSWCVEPTDGQEVTA